MEQFLKSVEDEIEYLGIDTDLELYRTALTEQEQGSFQASSRDEYVISERTDRPTVVKGGKLWFSRPLEDFSEGEREIVYNEAISDVLAYEAGVFSPTTYTQSDFDEFEQLFDMEELESQPEEYFFGKDHVQERINASFLMRHNAEDIRSRALRLEDFLSTLEKHDRDAKSILFESDESHFNSASPPGEYNELLRSLVDLSEGGRTVEQVDQTLQNVIQHPSLKDDSREIFETLGDRLTTISHTYKAAQDEKKMARGDLVDMYEELFEQADDRLLAASLFYQVMNTEGQERMRSVDNELTDNILSLEFVSDDVADNFDVLREYLVDRSYEPVEVNDNSDMAETVREFLNEYKGWVGPGEKLTFFFRFLTVRQAPLTSQ